MKKLFLLCLSGLLFQVARAQSAHASFTAQDQCDAVTVVFTNTSTVGAGDSIVENVWFTPSAFGNDTLSTDKDFVHVFQKGIHIVGLTIHTRNGDSSTFLDTLTTYGPLNLDFYFFNPCTDSNSTEFVSGTGNVTDSWDFGDGGRDTGNIVYHSYSAPGTYIITLKYASPVGCRDSVQRTITIYPRVVASFHYTIQGRTIIANADKAGLAYYSWWPNRKVVTIFTTTFPHWEYTYPSDGKYIVQFRAGNDYACFAEFNDTILIGTEGISPEGQSAEGLHIYPNPFRENTQIEYNLTAPSRVRLALYATDGREVGILQNGTEQAGKYTVTVSSAALSLKPGIYFLTVTINGNSHYYKMVKVE